MMLIFWGGFTGDAEASAKISVYLFILMRVFIDVCLSTVYLV